MTTAPPQRQHGVPKSSSSAPSGPSRFEASPWPAAFAPRLFFFFRDWWHKGYTKTQLMHTHTHDVQLIHKRYQKWCTDEIQKIHMKYTRKTNKLSWRHLDVFHVGQVCFALSLRPGVLLPPVRLEALMPMSHDAVQPPRSLVIISYIYILIYKIYSNQSTTVFLMVHVNSWDSQKPVHPESLEAETTANSLWTFMVLCHWPPAQQLLAVVQHEPATNCFAHGIPCDGPWHPSHVFHLRDLASASTASPRIRLVWDSSAHRFYQMLRAETIQRMSAILTLWNLQTINYLEIFKKSAWFMSLQGLHVSYAIVATLRINTFMIFIE